MAYQEGSLGMHSPAKIRVTREVNGESKTAIIITTIGRIIFNNPIPQDLGFVDRTDPAHEFDLEVSFVVKKKDVSMFTVFQSLLVFLILLKHRAISIQQFPVQPLLFVMLLFLKRRKNILPKQKNALMKSHITITMVLLLMKSVLQQ